MPNYDPEELLKLLEAKYPDTVESPEGAGPTLVYSGRPWSEFWAETSADEDEEPSAPANSDSGGAPV